MKEYISDDIIRSSCYQIANKIKSESPLDKVKLIGITRGGLIPLGYIAYILNVKDIQILNISSYTDDNQSSVITDNSKEIEVNEHTYIIDDLCDTGKTISYIHKKYPQAKIATTLYKSNHDALWHRGFKVNSDSWVVFPWDEDYSMTDDS